MFLLNPILTEPQMKQTPIGENKTDHGAASHGANSQRLSHFSRIYEMLECNTDNFFNSSHVSCHLIILILEFLLMYLFFLII